MVRRAKSPGFHLPQFQVDPPAGGLPSRLTARQSGADDQQFIGYQEVCLVYLVDFVYLVAKNPVNIVLRLLIPWVVWCLTKQTK
jgi:hypothetical protein